MNGVSSTGNQVQQLAYANKQLLEQAGQRFEAQRQKVAEIAIQVTNNVVASAQRAAEVSRIGMNIDTKA